MAKRTNPEAEAPEVLQTEMKKQKKEKKKDKGEKKQKQAGGSVQPAPATFSLFGGKTNPDLDDVFSKGVSCLDRKRDEAHFRPLSQSHHQLIRSPARLESLLRL